MLIGLKAVGDLLFLKCLVKRVELTKKIFMQDVEEGGEIFIPQELSQNQLPYSFRYYDPILTFI